MIIGPASNGAILIAMSSQLTVEPGGQAASMQKQRRIVISVMPECVLITDDILLIRGENAMSNMRTA